MLENTRILRARFREAIASHTLFALIKGRRSDVANSKEEIFIENYFERLWASLSTLSNTCNSRRVLRYEIFTASISRRERRLRHAEDLSKETLLVENCEVPRYSSTEI